jgi:hypothetical protein
MHVADQVLVESLRVVRFMKYIGGLYGPLRDGACSWQKLAVG